MKKKDNDLIVRNNKMVIMLVSLIVVTFIMLIFTSIKLYESLDIKEDNNPKMVSNNKVYGTVVEVGENYAKIQELENDKTYLINTDKNLDEGDLIVAYFDENYEDSSKIEVIASKQDISNNVVTTEITTTNPPTTVIKTTTTFKNTSRTTTKTTTTTTTTKKVEEEEVVSYFATEYNTVNTYSNDQTFLDKAKEKFIILVDFIFYDGEIKGKKFNELTASAKAKVIYYALLIDSKIDSKWPNYKANINNKYNDIKAKLIAKYLDLTTSVCDNNPDTCADFKRDFHLLKTSVGLTWDVIKGAFKYAYNTGKDKLVLWYEMFSGKV